MFFAQVHDVMGLDLRNSASLFQLECDRVRVRYGVILLAFEFDPPVAADVLVALNGETVSWKNEKILRGCVCV